MKHFKCGKCAKRYKVDPSKVQSSRMVIACSSCGAKNAVRFGPVLVAQSKGKVKQFPLNLGDNAIGRKSDSSQSRIQLEDKFVSRTHAKINLEEKDNKLYFFISDLNSKNGTHNKTKVKIKSDIKYPITTNDFYVVGLTKLSIKFN